MGGGELVNVCLGVLAEKLLEEFVFVVGRGGCQEIKRNLCLNTSLTSPHLTFLAELPDFDSMSGTSRKKTEIGFVGTIAVGKLIGSNLLCHIYVGHRS